MLSTPSSTRTVMTTDELRAQLEQLFPPFSASCAGSLFRSKDGCFTPHGLCAEFSRFYRAHVADFGLVEKVELFRLVESIVASDPHDSNPLANSVCTCFLENIADTEAGEISRPLMGPFSRAYFDPWHVRPSG